MSTVWITLGGHTELGIDRENDLVMRQVHLGNTLKEIGLGKATKKRIEELKSYLERLKCHCE